MSLQEKPSKLTDKLNLTPNKDTYAELSTQNQTYQESTENEKLIKPIPINIKLIKRSKSEITTKPDSTLTIKQIVQELKMPFIYPNYNYPNIPEYNHTSLGENYFNHKESDENNTITYKKEKTCCNCTKTQCLKKYCECFANNNYCEDCNCKNCMNKFMDINPQNGIKINENENENENEKINCTCSKSNCNKKYCECFKVGKKCSKICRCLNCLNMEKLNYNIEKNKSNENNIINDVLYKNNKNNINLEEKKLFSSKSSECENVYDTFKIQRISVFINKYQTSIDVEKLSTEEIDLLSRKRKLS
jgi:hypothetical protein